MTLEMSEPVIVHTTYDFVVLQDFEVEFIQNSDEEPQELTYQILSVTASNIKVQLNFEFPVQVS